MACEITSGYTKPNCRQTGGVQKFYLYTLANRASYTLSANEDEITALSLDSGKYAYEFAVEQDLSMVEETPTGSRENGTFYIEQVATIILNDNRKETRNLINVMGRSSGVGVIYQDQEGVYRHAGLIGGMVLNEGTVGTGAAKGDRNGSTLTLNAQEKFLAPEISSTIVNSLLESAS